jgi:hypothetical protein
MIKNMVRHFDTISSRLCLLPPTCQLQWSREIKMLSHALCTRIWLDKWPGLIHEKRRNLSHMSEFWQKIDMHKPNAFLKAQIPVILVAHRSFNRPKHKLLNELTGLSHRINKTVAEDGDILLTGDIHDILGYTPRQQWPKCLISCSSCGHNFLVRGGQQGPLSSSNHLYS